MSTVIATIRDCCQPAPSHSQREKGRKRGQMDDRRIEPRRLIGEAHIGRALLNRLGEQRIDLVEQCVAGFPRDPHPQRASEIERARVDGCAGGYGDRAASRR